METGITHGIGWTRIVIPHMSDDYATPATRGRPTDSVVVLHDPKRQISEYTLGCLRKGGDARCRGTLDADMGIRFFDEAVEFPDDRVTHLAHSFNDFDADAWMREAIDVPDDVEITLHHDAWKRRLHVSARTIRNGVEADVRRKVGSNRPFVEEIETHLRFFRRNCPRSAPGTTAGAACGSHLNAMLPDMTKLGATLVEGWRRQVAARRAKDLTVPMGMIGDATSIVTLTLRPSGRSATALMKATLRGGHTVEDDDSGTTIILKQSLPAAAIGALPGRNVRDVVDVPWLTGLAIKTARPGEDGKSTILRVATETQTMRVPARTPQDEDIREGMERIVGEGKRIATFDEAALPALSRLTPEQLLITFSVMLDTRRMRLDDVGLEGWTLVLNGTTIQVERSPGIDIGTLVGQRHRRLPSDAARS